MPEENIFLKDFYNIIIPQSVYFVDGSKEILQLVTIETNQLNLDSLCQPLDMEE
jgi:hypothetical protein